VLASVGQLINLKETTLFISACVLALSASGAFAQSQPAPGASSKGNVGPGASHDMTTPRTGTTTGTTATQPSGTAPSSSMSNSSSEGNVGPGTNNNSGKQPGGR
jgi:hypothetical protein